MELYTLVVCIILVLLSHEGHHDFVLPTTTILVARKQTAFSVTHFQTAVRKKFEITENLPL